MTEQDQIQKAEYAQALLDNPTLKKGLEVIKQEILQQWELSPPSDTEQREYLFKLYQAQLHFERLLFGYIQTGKIAKNALKQQNETTIRRKKSVKGIYGN